MDKLIDKRDYSISLIRLLSTICIVSCHIMLYYNFFLAWWFNVGVQIFLCMSGYLYGWKKYDDNDIRFIKKQFSKILVDYYLVIAIVLGLFFCFSRDDLNDISVWKILLTYETIQGGEHLWYIPYCLTCYLFTPLFSRFFDSIFQNKTKHIIKDFFLLEVFIIALCKTFFSYYNPAWIVCYILGFFLGRLSRDIKHYRLLKKITIAIAIMAVIMNTLQILQEYILHFQLLESVASFYSSFCNYSHVMLGVALFMILRNIFLLAHKKRYPKIVMQLCIYSDKYSYDIYLVHQFMILGRFSLMDITKYPPINITIIVVTIILAAMVINRCSCFLKTRF